MQQLLFSSYLQKMSDFRKHFRDYRHFGLKQMGVFNQIFTEPLGHWMDLQNNFMGGLDTIRILVSDAGHNSLTSHPQFRARSIQIVFHQLKSKYYFQPGVSIKIPMKIPDNSHRYSSKYSWYNSDQSRKDIQLVRPFFRFKLMIIEHWFV